MRGTTIEIDHPLSDRPLKYGRNVMAVSGVILALSWIPHIEVGEFSPFGLKLPEGGEILASMQRAVLREDRVEWTETCYCPTPLRHERMVVYDEFFTDLGIDSIDAPPSLKGKSFWEFLGLNHEAKEK